MPDANKYSRGGDLAYVRQIVEQTGLTQQSLAERVGVSRMAIGRYYNGHTPMPYAMQYCIEQLHGAGTIPPHDLRYAIKRADTQAALQQKLAGGQD